MNTIETIGLALVVFASTNVDDFFLLLAFFADGRSRKSQVVLGQYLGTGLLVVLSLAIASGTMFLPRGWIDYLGILPLLIGVKELLQLRQQDDPDKRQHLVDTALESRRSSLVIAGLAIANGADNIGVYTPLFAKMGNQDIAVMVTTFTVLIGVWCVITHWLAKTRHAVIRRTSGLRFITPIVLILVGLWILF